MKKKFNLKEINFKDKKFIFPLVIFVLVLFIGWFIFGIVQDLNGNQTGKDNKDTSEIQSIPAGEGGELLSKADAMNESFREAEDYTALQGIYDPTLISSDTTIYTAAEIAYLDSLERIAQGNQAEIEAINEEIRRSNQDLAEQRKGRSVGGVTGYESNYSYDSGSRSSGGNQELIDEMIMYQKLINGEEILTPAQEAARKEEQIRLEERQKVLSELNSAKTAVVEKSDNINKSSFNSLSSKSKKQDSQSPNTFKAMVDQTVKVEQGSRIRFTLLEDIRVNGSIVPKGTRVYGTVSGFSNQRIITDITTILVNGEQIKVDLSVLDVDGIQGLYVPKSDFRDATKAIASQAVQGGQMNTNANSESFVGVAAQALQNAYQGITQAVSNNITKNKATVKYNTIVYLTNAQ